MPLPRFFYEAVLRYMLEERMRLTSLFKKQKNIIIGAIHLPPLLGYKGFPGLDVAIKNALADLRALEQGGADAIIFENNYDVPHQVEVGPSTISAMTIVGERLRKATKLPIGISVLWNDYRTALAIAKTLKLQFVRVPVFVDKVETSYGVVEGSARQVMGYRAQIDAHDVAIFTDIHVKHAVLLSKHSLIASAKLAIKRKSDALIITGKWTGDAPDVKEIVALRKSVGKFPIFVGSGLNAENAQSLFRYANGAIVSTSLKEGGNKKHEVNVKGYEQRIDKARVRRLTHKLK